MEINQKRENAGPRGRVARRPAPAGAGQGGRRRRPFSPNPHNIIF